MTKTETRKRQTSHRRCLACTDPFESEGPHNRICRRCKTTQAWRQGWL